MARSPRYQRPWYGWWASGMLIGFVVGDLPDGLPWSGIKAAFAVAIFVAIFLGLRRTAKERP